MTTYSRRKSKTLKALYPSNNKRVHRSKIGDCQEMSGSCAIRSLFAPTISQILVLTKLPTY